MKNMKCLTCLVILLFYFNLANSQSYKWEQTNGPYGGNISALCISPNGILLAGVVNQGIYISTNDGEYWSKVDTKLPYSQFNSIEYDKKGNIYAGTFDAIFKSTDNGLTWKTFKPYSSGYTISKYLIINDNKYLLLLNNSILISTEDNGYSWTEIINLRDKNLYANTFSLTSDGLIFFPTNSGLYSLAPGSSELKKTDNGLTFSGYNSYLDFSEDSSGIYYVATSQGVFRSTDHGNNWISTAINRPVNSITIDKRGRVYITGQSGELYFSDNHGETWLSNTTDFTEIKGIRIKNSFDVYAYNSDGVYKLSSKTGEFTSINKGLNFRRVTSVISNTGYQLVCLSNRKFCRSTDGGKTWIEKQLGNNNLWPNTIAMGWNGEFFLGAYSMTYGCILKSTDNGESWISKNVRPDFGSATGFAFSSDSIIYASIDYKGVFRSSDNGETWIQGNPLIIPYTSSSIAVDSKKNVYLSVFDGIYRSTDKGNTWIECSPILPGRYTKEILLIYNDNIYVNTPEGIYRSRDKGLSWIKIFNANNYPKPTLLYDKNGALFLTTYNNVLFSTDDGNSWSSIFNNSFQDNINGITITSDGILYAGTNSFGLIKIVKPANKISDFRTSEKTTFELHQNYPNPFNPSTDISFHLTVYSKVTLKVYDVMGREVKTLLDEYKPAGKHKVTFDAKGLSGGVYLYKLIAGGQVISRKMVLMK